MTRKEYRKQQIDISCLHGTIYKEIRNIMLNYSHLGTSEIEKILNAYIEDVIEDYKVSEEVVRDLINKVWRDNEVAKQVFEKEHLKAQILERNNAVYTDVILGLNKKMEVIRDILDFQSRKDGLKLLLIELVLDENIEEIKQARKEIEINHNMRLKTIDEINYYATEDLSYTKEQYYEISSLYKERIDLIDMVLAHYGIEVESMNKTDAFMEYALIEEKANRVKVSKMLQDKD